ncbi:flagella basal body P-ring formation protein FlgA [Ornithinimicrobium sp. Arc0846-15]|nr:flagella basal body P-ring formation protein FlgA [Ornithinimicrobium laminariae]
MSERASRNAHPRSRPRFFQASSVRRGLAAVCVAIAAWLAFSALGSAAVEDATSVVVVAANVPAGTSLSEDDLIVEARPIDDQPNGAIVDPNEAIGATTSHPLQSGEILTALDLSYRDWLDEGQLAISVPVADPLILRAAEPGQRVDVWTAGLPEPLAQDALVLGQSAPTEAPALLIAVDVVAAQHLSTHGLSATTAIVAIRSNSPTPSE